MNPVSKRGGILCAWNLAHINSIAASVFVLAFLFVASLKQIVHGRELLVALSNFGKNNLEVISFICFSFSTKRPREIFVILLLHKVNAFNFGDFLGFDSHWS